MNTDTTILYRPLGPKELALIVAAAFRAFPPRPPEVIAEYKAEAQT